MQGDTLASYLFVIAIDYMMTTALRDKDLGFTVHLRRSRRHSAVKVTDVDFADDLALTTTLLQKHKTCFLELSSPPTLLDCNSTRVKPNILGLTSQMMMSPASEQQVEKS